MKTKNKNSFKKLIVLLAVIAFATNTNALTGNKKDKGNINRNNHSNTRGNGHSNHGNGNGYGHTNHGNGNGYGHHKHNKNCGHGGGDSIPLDGGLSLLLAGATVFGIKKLREKK